MTETFIHLFDVIPGSTPIVKFMLIAGGIYLFKKIIIDVLFLTSDDAKAYVEEELHKARSIGMESEYKQANKRIKANSSRGILSYLKGK